MLNTKTSELHTKSLEPEGHRVTQDQHFNNILSSLTCLCLLHALDMCYFYLLHHK